MKNTARLHAFAFLAFLFCLLSLSSVHAANSLPIGINLDGVNYWTSEDPFLDIFKTGFTQGSSTSPIQGWMTQSSSWDTGEEKYVQIDTNGWVTSLTAKGESSQSYTFVGILLRRSLDTYPAGNYVVLYQGQGTLGYGFDGTLVSSSPGRDIFNVATPSGGGIWLQIKATDPNHTGNYLRNIQVVYSPDSTATNVGVNEAALVSGQIFNPTLLARLAPFRALRFMDWMNTNASPDGPDFIWSDRPAPSNAFWSGPYGVPMEIMVDLANQLGADAWFNMPTYADTNFVTNFATYAHQHLGSTQKVYLEYTNEFWNGGTGLPGQMEALGHALWPSQNQDFALAANYYGMKVATNCDAWKTAWGADASRVVCVMGNQTTNWGVVDGALKCPYWSGAPCSAHGIDAIGDTSYFGPGDIPTSWLSLPDGGMSNLCAAFTTPGLDPNSPKGYIADQLAGLAYDQAYLKSNYPNLKIVAYEGSPVTQTSNAAIGALYINFANNSPCMQTVYTTYLNALQADGYLALMNHFQDVELQNSSDVQWGLWGALNHIWDTGAPKYNALVNFISGNEPLAVTLTSPISGSDYAVVPATVPLAATAVDGVAISKVEFYNGSALLTTDTTAPYTYSWTGVATGSYTITAKAYDRNNMTAVSPAATITVGAVSTPPPGSGTLPTPVLNLPSVLPLDADLSFTYSSLYTNVTFAWTITPVTGGTPALRGSSSPMVTSGAVAEKTAAPSLSLAQWSLSPGLYTISVQASNGVLNPSATASQTVSLVFSDLSSVRVYPNPWRKDKHVGFPITFDQMPAGSDVKIFTVSGHKVKELNGNTGSATWDLTNDSGDKVASGIYMYVIKDSQGNKTRGKVAVIQ